MMALPAQKILVSMCAFAPDAGGTKHSVRDVSRVPDPEFSDGLHQLVFMSLVDPIRRELNDVRYTIHQLTHYFVMSDIVRLWG